MPRAGRGYPVRSLRPITGSHTAVPISWAPSATDPVGGTDTLTITQDGVRSQTDLVGVTDAGLFQLSEAIDAADVVGATDALTVTRDAVVPQTDLAGVADAGSFTQDWVRSQTDAVGVTDAGVFNLGDVSLGVADQVGATDTVTAVAGYARSQSDSVRLTDSITVTGGHRWVTLVPRT